MDGDHTEAVDNAATAFRDVLAQLPDAGVGPPVRMIFRR